MKHSHNSLLRENTQSTSYPDGNDSIVATCSILHANTSSLSSLIKPSSKLFTPPLPEFAGGGRLQQSFCSRTVEHCLKGFSTNICNTKDPINDRTVIAIHEVTAVKGS